MIFSALLTLAMIYSMFSLPARLNENPIQTAKAKRATARLTQVQKTISYGQIFAVKRAVFCLITVIFAMIYAIFFDAFLSFNILEMGIDKSYVGYFLSLFALFYTIIAFCVSHLIKKFGARKVSLGSYLTISVGCLVLGPSNFIQSPNCYSINQVCTSGVDICAE